MCKVSETACESLHELNIEDETEQQKVRVQPIAALLCMSGVTIYDRLSLSRTSNVRPNERMVSDRLNEQ